MYITCQLDWYIYMEMYNLSLSVIGQKVKKKSPGFEPGYVPEDGSLIDHIDLEPRWGMDLRGLKGSKEGPGQHKGGGRKENLKKAYKKPGTSTDEARSLRTIQVTCNDTPLYLLVPLHFWYWTKPLLYDINLASRCGVEFTSRQICILFSFLNFKTLLSNSVFFTFVMHKC